MSAFQIGDLFPGCSEIFLESQNDLATDRRLS